MSYYPNNPSYAADPKDITLQADYRYGGSQPVVAQPMTSTNNTTVIINQTVAHQPPRMWSTDLCGCFDDLGICFCAVFCEVCAAVQLSRDMGEHTCVPCCVPGWLIVLRTKLRMQQNIQGTVMNDCCRSVFCGYCVLCQMMREVKQLKNSGIKLS